MWLSSETLDTIAEDEGMNEPIEESEDVDPYDNELTIGGVTVAECRTTEDAWFLVHILQEQGIRSAVSLPDKRMDLRGPRVNVAPDDGGKATLVLSVPIPAGKREAYDSQPEVEPDPLPVCPKCGSQDPILEGVDQSNHWRCGVCGIKWDELLPTL